MQKQYFFRKFKISGNIFLGSLGVFFVLLCVQAYGANEHYEIGVLADRGKEKVVQSWKPVADYTAVEGLAG